MRDAIALKRYLERHIEAGLVAPEAAGQWQHALVIPAYRESPEVVQALSQLRCDQGQILAILVLNRPASDQDPLANRALRDAVKQLPSDRRDSAGDIYLASNSVQILLHDMDALGGAVDPDQGVGLARKTGCDIALAAIARGAIASPWICCTDADATLPPGYFEQLAATPQDAVAALFPFTHIAGADPVVTTATGIYELRLHHYVLGLEYAGSPWAWHNLGSCLAVRASAYAHCRGFPRRSGAEDFYLLNKLAKLGPIARLQGERIRLAARASTRVPFGTGPAVAKLLAQGDPLNARIFNHPAVFTTLRALLRSRHALADEDSPAIAKQLTAQHLPEDLALTAQRALQGLNIDAALTHCRRHSRDNNAFVRHFDNWFDAARTLKFLNAMAVGVYGKQSLASLAECTPQLWPEPLPAEQWPALRQSHDRFRQWR